MSATATTAAATFGLIFHSSFHFASAVVTVDSSHMTSWSSFGPPSNFVSGHVSAIWFMVSCWPLSQDDDWERPHLCRFAWHEPWSVWKQFSGDHNYQKLCRAFERKLQDIVVANVKCGFFFLNVDV